MAGRLRCASVVVCLLVLAACADGDGDRKIQANGPSSPSSSTTSTAPAASSSRPNASPASAEPAGYGSSIQPIDADTTARMRSSWRPGCPVALNALRLVSVTYWTFDGIARQGELVVHKNHAAAMATVFEDLFKVKFPIEQMRLVDEFDGDDDRSMAANNTSAFNCRRVSGGSRWSEHAYGGAVDINPLQNPYVRNSGEVQPPAGRTFTDRSKSEPGMITAYGPVVAAFEGVGWEWGGDWTSSKDYQHFSASGR